MNEDYTQPFWVGWNNPRFPYARYGYIPPEEEKYEEDLSDKVKALEERPQITYTKDQWEFIEGELKRLSRPVLTNKQWDTFNQLSLQVDHLQGKFNELIASRKTKGSKYK